MRSNISFTAAWAEMSRYVHQGIAAMNVRDTDAAILAFERAAELASKSDLGVAVNIGIRRNLAKAYRTARQLAQAEQIYRELLAQPDLPPEQRPYIQHGLGLTLAEQSQPSAVGYLVQAASEYTQPADRCQAYLDLAALEMERGAYADGLALLSSLDEPDAGNQRELGCQFHLTLARIHLGLGRPEEATHHLQRAEAILTVHDMPILRAQWLSVHALRKKLAGESGALADAVRALELAALEADPARGEVFRPIARIFREVVG